jgi:asparagine synthase (glutamine-hydrolysing)
MERLSRSFASRWQPLQGMPVLVRSALYQVGRRVGLSEGRLDVLRRSAAEEPFYWGLDVVFSDLEKERLYRRAGFGRGASAVVREYYADLEARRPNADFLQQMSYVELCNRLPELLLMRVDKFSMAHSLEARAPFLDHELVSYALSLPQHSKISDGQTKKVLKQAVRGWLPDEVIDRRKQGFRVPLPEWLAGPLAGWAEQRLFSKAARELDFLDFDYIRSLWRRHTSGAEDCSFDLWCLINVFSWYECWFA